MIRALIVAHDADGVIGVDGRIPWRCPGDLRMFRALTAGCPVIMGRGTWDSLPAPLVGRANIVVSRTKLGAARSLSEAWQWAEAICVRSGAARAWVIGGEALYRTALYDVTEAYVTRVEARADTAGASRVARFPLREFEALPREWFCTAQGFPDDAPRWEQTGYRIGGARG